MKTVLPLLNYTNLALKNPSSKENISKLKEADRWLDRFLAVYEEFNTLYTMVHTTPEYWEHTKTTLFMSPVIHQMRSVVYKAHKCFDKRPPIYGGMAKVKKATPAVKEVYGSSKAEETS